MKAITFDATGTLLTVVRPVGETYAEVAMSFGVELAREDLSKGFAAEFPRMPPLAFPGSKPGEIPGLERDWWHRLVGSVVAHAGGVGEFGPFFDALYEHYARGGAWRAYPDALDALRQLKEEGYRLGVVSNYDSRLENVLRALELDHYFDVVVYSSAAGAAKPDPAIFEAALSALSVLPGDAVHVGDQPRTDIEGARACGMHAILLDRTGESRSGTSMVTVSSLLEVRAHLSPTDC